MRFFVVVLCLLAAGCVADAGALPLAIDSAPCGAQDQPCCSPPDGGVSHCANGTITCDGLAYASAAAVSTGGICGSYGGLHQPCGPGAYCFAPHVCMVATDGAPTCIDPVGGAQPTVCGNAGEPCCTEVDHGTHRDPPPPGPAVWCREGLLCSSSGNCG